MNLKQGICVFAIALLVTACGSAERKANKSQAKVNEERLSLVEEYQKCVDKAGDNAAKAEECETLRKSAEALK